MTATVSFNSPVSPGPAAKTLEEGNRITLESKAEHAALPRFNLRKRSCSISRNGDATPAEQAGPLHAVNSAFLSNLFADVANVEESDDESSSPMSTNASSEDSDIVGFVEARPVKKSRLSMSRSISRCGKSFKNLGDAVKQDSPTGVMDLSPSSVDTAPRVPSLNRVDSLHFQLNCVSDDPQSAATAGELAFPHLPATVSNTSCNTLTRNLSDLQSSLAENPEKDSYGWFVVVDEATSASPRETANPYAKSATDLAFVAPTAPNADNQDAEVEWAKAADTVDDVLGDFF